MTNYADVAIIITKSKHTLHVWFFNFCFPKIYLNEYCKLHISLTIKHFTTLCCKPLISFSSHRSAEIFIFVYFMTLS